MVKEDLECKESAKESISRGASILVCGAKSAMGKQVLGALLEEKIIESEEMLSEMKSSGRLLMELWGE